MPFAIKFVTIDADRLDLAVLQELGGTLEISLAFDCEPDVAREDIVNSRYHGMSLDIPPVFSFSYRGVGVIHLCLLVHGVVLADAVVKDRLLHTSLFR
jgi:hypothetical protein